MWIVLALSFLGDPASAATNAARYGLGLRQYEEGDFEAAVFTLDALARDMGARHTATREVVETLVLLGASYAGLNHDSAARAKFRTVLQLDPAHRLDEDRFPRRVVDLFKAETLRKDAKRSRRRGVLLSAGGAAVGALALGISLQGTPSNRPPTADIAASPNGSFVVDVTTVTFSATASDPDFDPLRYRWSLGDGSVSEDATVRHVYRAEGTFDVTLVVSDGRGEEARASHRVVARSLNGRWTSIAGFSDGAGGFRTADYRCTQAGTAFNCLVDYVPWAQILGYSGSVADPRQVNLAIDYAPPFRDTTCEGTFDLEINRFQCLNNPGGGLQR